MMMVHRFKHLPIFIYALDVLIFMFTIYGIVYAMGEGQVYKDLVLDKPINYLKNIYNSLLPIYVFYYFSRKNKMTEIDIRRFVFFFFIMAILSFWNLELQSVMLDDDDWYINNKGYALLSLFPAVVYLHNRPFVQYMLLIVIFFFILLGMKRGAILIAFICLAVFLVERMRNTTQKEKFIIVFLSITIVVSLGFFIMYLVENNDYFYLRLQQTLEGHSSGREILYSSLMSHLAENNSDLQLLFGAGANATLSITVNYAHNDWLEICVNQGFFGVIIYAIYWFAFWYDMRRTKKDRHVYLSFLLLFIIFFAKTIFSMSYADMNIYSTCILGYCLSCNLKKNEKEGTPSD